MCPGMDESARWNAQLDVLRFIGESTDDYLFLCDYRKGRLYFSGNISRRYAILEDGREYCTVEDWCGLVYEKDLPALREDLERLRLGKQTTMGRIRARAAAAAPGPEGQPLPEGNRLSYLEDLTLDRQGTGDDNLVARTIRPDGEDRGSTELEVTLGTGEVLSWSYPDVTNPTVSPLHMTSRERQSLLAALAIPMSNYGACVYTVLEVEEGRLAERFPMWKPGKTACRFCVSQNCMTNGTATSGEQRPGTAGRSPIPPTATSPTPMSWTWAGTRP